MDKTNLFLLNVFVNSILAFFTVVVLIEGLIFLFRIPKGRIAAAMRLLPILKLPIDLFLYDFSSWTYLQGINPLLCEKETRMLSLMCSINDKALLPISSSIQLTVPGNFTFTIADVISYAINPTLLNFFAILLLFLTAGQIIWKCFNYYRAYLALNALTQSSRPLYRSLNNSILSSCIDKYGIQIRIAEVGSPFVAGLLSSTIYIPSHLAAHLSKEEYEAILAHEIEHIRCKDSLVRLVCDFIGILFWWVPTKWLRRCIEEGQEIGCDLQCKIYGIETTSLASAICKSLKHSISTPHYLFSHYFAKQAAFKRVQLLLQDYSTRFGIVRYVFSALAISIALVLIVLGKFWIF